MNFDKLIIFCDGGARGNPGPAAIGVVVKDKNNHTLHKISKTIGNATNNVAEYQAVIAAFEWLNKQAFKDKLRNIEFYLDSKLLVNQLNGKFKIKNSKLKILIARIKDLESRIGAINHNFQNSLFDKEKGIITIYKFIPRENNIQADLLVNQALNASKQFL